MAPHPFPPGFRSAPTPHARLAVALLLALLPLLAGATLRGELAEGGDDVNVVRYHASDSRSSWSGVAPIGALELIFDPDDLTASELRVTVPAGRFDSGNFVRDANARRAVFDAGDYPEIVFEARTVAADADTLAENASREVTLRGDLSMHGVTREIETVATVTRDGDRLEARGELSVLLSEFEMNRPSFLGVTVDDSVRIEYAVAATLAPASP